MEAVFRICVMWTWEMSCRSFVGFIALGDMSVELAARLKVEGITDQVKHLAFHLGQICV